MSLVTLFGVTFDPELARVQSARIRRAAQARMRTQVELRELPPGVARDDAVIWIEDEESGGVPVFQFDHDERLYDVVAAANRLLGAGQDPWGALAWWLGTWPDPRGSIRPIDHVGAPDESRVLLAVHRLLS